MSLAPIALFVYSRVECLSKTVETLKKNIYASDTELFIFSDGPNERSIAAVDEVRKYIRTIDGFKKITIIESSTNKGLANSIIFGVTQIVNTYGKVIVLEDDLISSPFFLRYINEALDRYENEPQVGCICGYIYPITPNINENTFFIRGADCLGWATWERAWNQFERDSNKLILKINLMKLYKTIDYDWSYPYVDMLQSQIDGNVDSWAIRWLISSIINNQYCLYPTKSFVQHIGYDANSTHCKQHSKYLDTELDINTNTWSKIPIEENKIALKAFEHHLRRMSHYRFRKLIHITHKIKQRIVTRFPKLTHIITFGEDYLRRLI